MATEVMRVSREEILNQGYEFFGTLGCFKIFEKEDQFVCWNPATCEIRRILW